MSLHVLFPYVIGARPMSSRQAVACVRYDFYRGRSVKFGKWKKRRFSKTLNQVIACAYRLFKNEQQLLRTVLT
jgi:hypothetical protein